VCVCVCECVFVGGASLGKWSPIEQFVCPSNAPLQNPSPSTYIFFHLNIQ